MVRRAGRRTVGQAGRVDARGAGAVGGEIAGHVAINEIVVHGWDIAAATGHGYACETDLVQAASGWAAML